MSRETIEAGVAAVSSKVTYTGAGATVASWILSSEFGVLAGLFLGVAGLLVNWYFKRRQDRREQDFQRRQDEREQAEHLARMRKLARDSGRMPLEDLGADE